MRNIRENMKKIQKKLLHIKNVTKNYWFVLACLLVTMTIIGISIATLDPANSNSILFYTTISGTFTGALLAFTLTLLVEHKKEKEKRISAINSVLFTLLRQYNTIIQFRNYCQPYRNMAEPLRSLSLPCLQPPLYANLVFDFNELSFLLEKYAGTALELSVAEDSFHQAVFSIKERNNHHVNKVQATIKEKKLRGREIPEEELKNEFEEDVYEIMIRQTEDVYEHIRRNMTSIPIIQDKIIEAAENFYPNIKFKMFLIADEK